MNNKLVIGLLVGALFGTAACAGMIALFCGGILATTQPAVDASNDFLSLLGQGKTTEAYASTSESFKAVQDEQSFAVQVRQLALDDYESATWQSRSVVNNEGTVEGLIKCKNGSSFDATVRLVKENGGWKVAKVRVSNLEMPTYQIPPMPNEAELRKLVKETLLEFNKAVRADNFDPFYATISEYWKKQISPAELAAALHDFVDKKVDVSIIGNLTAKFDPAPVIDDNGFLVISGKYLNKDGRLSFQMKYLLEGGVWKLVGMDVRTGKE